MITKCQLDLHNALPKGFTMSKDRPNEGEQDSLHTIRSPTSFFFMNEKHTKIERSHHPQSTLQQKAKTKKLQNQNPNVV
jgi:hypothetical protein